MKLSRIGTELHKIHCRILILDHKLPWTQRSWAQNIPSYKMCRMIYYALHDIQYPNPLLYKERIQELKKVIDYIRETPRSLDN